MPLASLFFSRLFSVCFSRGVQRPSVLVRSSDGTGNARPRRRWGWWVSPPAFSHFPWLFLGRALLNKQEALSAGAERDASPAVIAARQPANSQSVGWGAVRAWTGRRGRKGVEGTRAREGVQAGKVLASEGKSEKERRRGIAWWRVASPVRGAPEARPFPPPQRGWLAARVAVQVHAAVASLRAGAGADWGGHSGGTAAKNGRGNNGRLPLCMHASFPALQSDTLFRKTNWIPIGTELNAPWGGEKRLCVAWQGRQSARTEGHAPTAASRPAVPLAAGGKRRRTRFSRPRPSPPKPSCASLSPWRASLAMRRRKRIDLDLQCAMAPSARRRAPQGRRCGRRRKGAAFRHETV